MVFRLNKKKTTTNTVTENLLGVVSSLSLGERCLQERETAEGLHKMEQTFIYSLTMLFSALIDINGCSERPILSGNHQLPNIEFPLCVRLNIQVNDGELH